MAELSVEAGVGVARFYRRAAETCGPARPTHMGRVLFARTDSILRLACRLGNVENSDRILGPRRRRVASSETRLKNRARFR